MSITVNTEAPINKAAKFKAVAALSKTLDKKNETQNSFVRLGDKVGILLPSISTGLPTFDYDVVGTGGLPKGRVIEIFGPESAGKTSTILHVIGECQKAGGVVAFIDAEHALDPTYAEVLGVNVEELVVMQPNSGEQALDAVDKLVDARAVDLIVVDSVAALVPEAELNGEIGDAHMGLQARMMSQAMRILTAKCARYGITVVFLNQIREKIGVMFGSPETTTGGRALKFFSSLRIDVRRKEALKKGEVIYGHQIQLKAVKNKCGVPFRKTLVDLIYETGFDKFASMVEFASTHGIFEMNGSWYHFEKEKIANGIVAVKAALRDNAELTKKVQAAVTKFITDRAAEAEKKAAL